MAPREHYHTKFEEGKFYHIYNRSVDKKPMFKNNGNYVFFLNRYDQYLSQVVDTYAYCLLGNHFHLLVRVKDIVSLNHLLVQSDKKSKTVHDVVSHQFRKFFQSYALAFNKQHARIGTLFQTPFKRALVNSDQYFTQLVYYIHANPQLHGLVDDFKNWNWSSYNRILIERSTKLKKEEVLEWFGNKEKYKIFHSQKQRIIVDENYILED